MWDLIKALYEQVGSPYPRASTLVAALIGALMFGGSWWLIGKQYDKETSRSSSSKEPDLRASTSDLALSAQNPIATKPSPVPLPSGNPTPGARQTDDREEVRVAAEDDNFSSVTLEEFFDRWHHGAKSSLQRDELEQEMLGKRVIWNGVAKNIEASGEKLSVWVAPIDGSYGTAFLDFPLAARAELLRIHEGQKIRFTGTIRHFVASPFLEDCKLLKVLD